MKQGINTPFDVRCFLDLRLYHNPVNTELPERYGHDSEKNGRHSKGLLWTVGIVMFLLIIGWLIA